MRGQSFYEICEHWTIDDVYDANQVLDAIEGMILKNRPPPPSPRGPGR